MIKIDSTIKNSDTSNTVFDLIVVGGGASGMMAAGQAGARGLKVLILEKNKKLGDKLRITGGGRCNITNDERNEHILLKMYGEAEPFLYSTFNQFGVKDTFTFFEGLGLPLVVEANQRVFPKSQKALDVALTLEKYIKTVGVSISRSSPVTKIDLAEGKIVSVSCGSTIYQASNYLLATGCATHAETGSSGDGFAWLREFGHTVISPTPTIVPLRVPDSWVKSLAGISMSDIAITFYLDEIKQFKLQGKILFTHFGISGPLILNSAKQVADLVQAGSVTASIDMYPELNFAELEKKVLETFDTNKNKTLKNVMKEIVKAGSQKGILILLENKLDTSKQVNLVTKEERKILVHILKDLSMTISGLMGFDRAVIADGGVPLEEINMKTMGSKKVSNLFVTGDLLHINRPSGGYSLQLCWTTGYVVGSNVDK